MVPLDGSDRELRRDSRRYLDVLLGRIDTRDRTRACTALLDGPISETRRGGLERMLLGSVADSVLRSLDRPLLLWNPTEVDAGAP